MIYQGSTGTDCNVQGSGYLLSSLNMFVSNELGGVL